MVGPWWRVDYVRSAFAAHWHADWCNEEIKFRETTGGKAGALFISMPQRLYTSDTLPKRLIELRIWPHQILLSDLLTDYKRTPNM